MKNPAKNISEENEAYTLDDIKAILLSLNAEEFQELKMRETFGRQKGTAIEHYVKKCLSLRHEQTQQSIYNRIQRF